MRQPRRTIGSREGNDGPAYSAALPETLAGIALFLDVDGTLLDIAPTPGSVVVPDGMSGLLRGLRRATYGAFALVSGRSIAFLDTILPAEGIPIAGLHGAESRDGVGNRLDVAGGNALDAAKARLADFAGNTPGVLFEDKGAAIAAHFRQAPAAEDAVSALMEAVASDVGPGFTLQRGKCVVELRPTGHDKGDALRRFMNTRPFAGRVPLAIGDDLTDEAMFQAANELGGRSVRVGRDARPTAARGGVASPADLRDWIERVVR